MTGIEELYSVTDFDTNGTDLTPQEIKEMIYEFLDNVTSYQSYIIEMRRLSNEGLSDLNNKNAYEETDKSRRIAHNSLIAKANMLNRVAKLVGKPPVIPEECFAEDGGDKPRKKIACYAFKIMAEFMPLMY